MVLATQDDVFRPHVVQTQDEVFRPRVMLLANFILTAHADKGRQSDLYALKTPIIY